MSIAAVPNYLGKSFDHAPPGHRFTLYLQAWRDDFMLDKNQKTDTIRNVLSLPDDSVKTLKALHSRQQQQAEAVGAEIFDALATAPFATGLGMEHPLENGFAFLNPYGLPYLPGSGVKGVLRKAALELARGDFGGTEGWTLDAITALFGGDPSEEPFTRGALAFWDVIPTLPGNKMRVDVMTPHQSDYYQGKQSPHDSGSPNPIPFLTVPPGAEFRFVVSCEEKYLKHDALKNGGWKVLLQAAFKHAFEWLGFGAKTAVGYGAMQKDAKAEQQREHERQQREEAERKAAEAAERATRLAQLSPMDRMIEEAIASKQPGQSDDSAVFNAIKAGKIEPDALRATAEKLKTMMESAKSWKETTAAKKPEKDKEHQRTLEVMKWLKS